MNSKIKLLLATFAVVSFAQVFANTGACAENCAESEDADFRSKKCGKFSNLAVCNNVLVGGSETVNGTLTVIGAVATGPLTVKGNEVVNGTLIATSTICAPYITLCPTPAAGTPGVPGIGGDLAYAALFNSATETIAGGGDITFNTQGPVGGAMTAVAPTTSITVGNAGVYRITLGVRAANDTTTNPLAIELDRSSLGRIAVFASDTLTTGTHCVNGSVLANLFAGDALTLKNMTNSGADAIILATDVAHGENAFLIAERVA